MLLETSIGDVFTPANQRLRRGKFPELGAKTECLIQKGSETPRSLPCPKQRSSFFWTASGDKAGDLAFN
jgi:hypothetical protein